MANVTHFNRKNFKMWLENVATAIASLRPDIVRLMDEEERPTCDVTDTRGRATMVRMRFFSKPLLKQDEYTRTKQDAAKLLMGVGHPNGLLFRVRQDRDLMDELRSFKMTTCQDPDEYFFRPEQLCSDLTVYR